MSARVDVDAILEPQQVLEEDLQRESAARHLFLGQGRQSSRSDRLLAPTA